jgi:exosortase
METKQNAVSVSINQRPSLSEELGQWLRDFPAEFSRCWQQLPNKAFFFILLAVWLALFQFLGNGTFGYINTASLMRWMMNAYSNPQSDGQDEHGMFIPFIVLALMWWKRKQLLATPVRTWVPGLLLLAGALALHVLGYRVQQPRISIVAFFAGIYALMGLSWGPGWMRASFFPFFLCVFCIPIASVGEPITFPLRHLVARIVAIICNRLLFMDVIREGTQLFNSSHTYGYEVAAACSGMRSLVAIFALGTIYGFVTTDKTWKRIVMMLAAFPLAVIGNVMRMLCIIIAAEISGQHAGDYIHESAVFSMIPYLPAFVGVYFLGQWLSKPRLQVKPASIPAPTPQSA